MKADDPLKSLPYPHFYPENLDYINQLRYERLMAKAREFKSLAKFHNVEYDLYEESNSITYMDQCKRIAEAYEERAKRIKERM